VATEVDEVGIVAMGEKKKQRISSWFKISYMKNKREKK
jgi:hypothetical protein